MHGPLFGEFMGTMVLIIFGDGVVANVLLKKSKAEGSGWIVITTGWAMVSWPASPRQSHAEVQEHTSTLRSPWPWPSSRTVGLM